MLTPGGGTTASRGDELVDIDLSHVYVHTGYAAAEVYYLLIAPEIDVDTPDLPYSNDNLPQFAQVSSKYQLLTDEGIDLSGENAEYPLQLMIQMNGAQGLTRWMPFTKGIATAVETVEAAPDDAEYFTIEGLRVNTPLQPGVYVRRNGGNASVILVK